VDIEAGTAGIQDVHHTPPFKALLGLREAEL
jgi:hypothetical protein